MLTNRQKKVLKAVIEEFVRTNEPVGSKTLINKPELMLDYSSATIRNEMATLEDLGYITKTHTSSGRVPSEEGYRFYVSNILSERSISQINLEDEESFPLVDDIIERNLLSREQAIYESMELVADLTKHTTVVMGTSGYNARIRKIQFVPLYERYAVVLMVTDKGNVESKKIIIPEFISIEDVDKVINYLNKVLYDCPIVEIYDRIKAHGDTAKIRNYIYYYDELIAAFVQTLTSMAKDDVFMSGKNNIFTQPEFQDSEKVKELLSAIEQDEIIRNAIIGEDGITVKIGHDNQLSVMNDCSIVSVPYELSNGEIGRIAIIGPMRMEYQKIIPLLEYIAKSIKKI